MRKLGLSLLVIGGSVFFLCIFALALTGCAVDPGTTPLYVPDIDEPIDGPPFSEKLKGVWVLLDDNMPSYTVTSDEVVCQTGTLHDWVVLVDPWIKGDRVFLEGKNHPVEFFFRDQLVEAEGPIYRILPGSRSYKEADPSGEIIVPDQYNWSGHRGGEFPYLMGTTLRVKDNLPGRIYLTNDEVPAEWIKDGNWIHFFHREDVVLLNPECLPEVIPPAKMKG